MFRLRVLNSHWIFVPALRSRDRLVATGVYGALQQGFGGVLHYYLFGLAPFSVVVWLDNGVTLRFGLSRNVK
jgi:hypothetical protein